jgi:hypothetical protein
LPIVSAGSSINGFSLKSCCCVACSRACSSRLAVYDVVCGPTSRQSCSMTFQAASFAESTASTVRALMPMSFSVLGISCMIS